ncbi:hypothetical protein [Desulfosporosinus youngiae]|uniref:Uncharacterized protein n=1 Tax=Desulfosporosinus youngiae DSM 17734 TaxID=768710 RepID=H5Y5A7_9FIRM|nr:hypothetical protein [Desulfosporosinus youngiae]EHQ90357.1 hypothetical protein DesyoDRAFT_3328 [Desulfosporosinus youngiae DSM 17734]
MNNYESIRLFRKNRVIDDTQGLSEKEDSPISEKQFSDLIIKPLENKKKEISAQKNSEQFPLPPSITEAVQKAFGLLGMVLKDNSGLNSLKDHDILGKLPLWLFKKLQ